jgi:hypothetical protein
MSSVKLFAGYVFAGAVASVFSVPTAHAAARVLVNNETPLLVQTPTLTPAGFVYQRNGTGSTVSVNTDGFLFCSNPGGSSNPSVTLAPLHEDQSFLGQPAHAWNLPTASDVLNIAYVGDQLSINRPASPSLSCHSVGANGEVARWISDGIFDDGYDTATEENYGHLINWAPPAGFSWFSPDGGTSPPDLSSAPAPCATASPAPVRAVESVACVAATGVNSASVRAGTMLTAVDTDGKHFTYLFRIDVLSGSSETGNSFVAPLHFQAPPSMSSASTADSGGTIYASLRDAYDAAYLGAAGTYCTVPITSNLTSTLSSGTCAANGAQVFNVATSGFLDLAPTVVPDGAASYVVVTRPVVGTHSNVDTPVVSASIMVDPATAAEGGDTFLGDDVVFGFTQTSQGFPWMHATAPTP